MLQENTGSNSGAKNARAEGECTIYQEHYCQHLNAASFKTQDPAECAQKLLVPDIQTTVKCFVFLQ